MSAQEPVCERRRARAKAESFVSEAEAEFRELRELVTAGATRAQPSFVHNTVSSVWHRAARSGFGISLAQWKTVCGWCFGLQSICEVLLSVADASEISGE